nr:hypothetical protein Iba_chr12fCG13150 [Ipomoea batatas]
MNLLDDILFAEPFFHCHKRGFSVANFSCETALSVTGGPNSAKLSSSIEKLCTDRFELPCCTLVHLKLNAFHVLQMLFERAPGRNEIEAASLDFI